MIVLQSAVNEATFEVQCTDVGCVIRFGISGDVIIDTEVT